METLQEMLHLSDEQYQELEELLCESPEFDIEELVGLEEEAEVEKMTRRFAVGVL